jgi:hypothetical protein
MRYRYCPCVKVLTVAALLLSFHACSDSKTPLQPSQEPASARPTSVPGPGPQAQGPVATMVGAGDIAVCGSRGAEETARLLDGIPGLVFTTGDLAYTEGSDQQFRDCYGPSWGRHRDRTRPTPGNHEYESAGAWPYFNYFGERAGPAGLGYYAYRHGDWEIFSLNSNVPGDEVSAQYHWLRAELAIRPSRCSLAYWHHPVITEGSHKNARHMLPIWRLLYDRGVDVVLAGHDHNYQRFAALDGDLRRDSRRGIRQFIIGTGGAPLYEVAAASADAEVRGSGWGVLKLSLGPDYYDWQFLPVAGHALSDSGRDVCH